MKGKRILSAVLSAALALQLSPLAAFAEDTPLLPDPAPAALTEPAPEEPMPEPETTPVLLAEPTLEPVAEPTPEPVPELAGEETALLAEPVPETEATPTPEPAAEPTATPAEETPAPEITAEPTPEPSAEPTPEPSTEPTAELSPDPAEQVQALIDALPDADAVTEDTADEVEAQLTAIDDAKATLTDEQLARLDFARYDAAANALLALWGEAPTDEVETLETAYAEPATDTDGYYLIGNENDLYWLATSAPKNVKAKLTQDIAVNSNVLNADGSLNTASSANFKAWTPITDFAGTLDGNGHTISGLYCNTPGSSYVGLFGSINGGTVTHLGVIDSYFAGSSYVGGVCGYNQGTISGCYSTATVNSTASGGVLVGYSFRTVENSFAYGHAQGNADSFGLNGRTMANCFYLSSTSSDGFWTGKAGTTAEQFQSGEVAYLLGLKDSFWKQDLTKNDAYPSFSGQNVGNADGNYHNHTDAANCEICKQANNKPNKVGSNYVITTETELKWFSTEVNNGSTDISAILATNITVDNWTPIGTQDHPFVGALDGNGYTVTITSMASNTDNAGLVGYLGSRGKVTNIKADGNITGNSNVGGVVGYCLGTLQNVINAATVSGTSDVGGVAGYIGNTESSHNLGNTGEVTGGSNVGGVVGTCNSGASLVNCYSSTCSLYGTHTKGGFINCYDTVGGQTGINKVDQVAFASGEVAYSLHTRGDGQTWGQNLTNDETAPNCLNNSPQVFRGTNGEYHNHTGESCNLCSATPPLENGVYQISTAQQLFGYAKIMEGSSRGTKAVLTADIVVTDTWTPIYDYSDTIDGSFSGTFEGQGHSITFAGTVATKQIGDIKKWTAMFATTESGAVIQNLTVSGSFTATSGRVGAIVGSNSGTIKNCRVINSTVSDNGGALVGYNGGTIQSCYSLVPDRPIARSNDGRIANSYHLGMDTTDSTVATQQQFKSGEIAMKLAAGNTDTDTLNWGQKIGSDNYPILGGAEVFCVEDYYHNHTGGSCPACDGKPDKNADGAYIIALYDNLLWLAKLVNGTLLPDMEAKPNVNAVLNDNIDVGSTWPGIGMGSNAYGGTFSGNGHTVTLKGAAENHNRLFGTTSTNAELNAICVKDGYLTYTDNAAVTSCYRPEVAPLFYNKAAGSTVNCYTRGSLCEVSPGDSARFTNCFAVTASGNGIISKDNEAFTSGEVAYLLAKGDSNWGQKLDSSKATYPIYGDKSVYYSADQGVGYHNHDSAECVHCSSKPNTEQDTNGNEWYIIRTAGELKWFANWVNGKIADENGETSAHPVANAKLWNNITLNPNVLDANGELNSGSFEQWTPIEVFTGTFDGQGYTISGLYFNDNSKSCVGLFYSVLSGGIIQNLNIADSYVCGKDCVGLLCGANILGTVQNCTASATVAAGDNDIGGICGLNQGGEVTDCRNTGTVSGNVRVGGICGYNDNYPDGNSTEKGEISSCTNTGNVTSTGSYAGGICGENSTGCTIQNSHSTGATVTGNSHVGGICGYNYSGSVTDCTASGSVTSTTTSGYAYVGGVCGNNYSGIVQDCTSDCTVTGTALNTGGICGNNNRGTVQECHNTGEVSGTQYVGGVCGYNTNGTVQGCYNTDKVSGTRYVGGVCGSNTNSITDSYSTGNVGSAASEYVGGICGYSKGTIARCYSYGGVTGTSDVGGICGGTGSSPSFGDCYYFVVSETNVDGFGNTYGNPTLTNCESKTAVEFRSGAVAYLLQDAAEKAATAGTADTATWGQTIGVNQSSVLAWQTDYQKVYPTAEGSTCKGYSNTENESREHSYNDDGECIYCGEKQPTQVAYTVTIPATVELGGKANITADDVVLPEGKQLNVKIVGNSDSKFTVTLDGDTREYTVTNGNDTVTSGSTVLTAENGDAEKSASLTFSAPTSTTYSGKYTGTVTFTVSVDEKTAS